MNELINESFRPSLNAEPLNLDINKLSEGEAKDEILKFSIKYLGEHITSSLLSKKVFNIEDKDEVRFLMNQMQNEIAEYADFRENRSNIFITCNKLSEKFLKQGGFSKLEKDLQDEEKKEAERIVKQDQLLDLDLKLRSFENRIGKKIIVAGIIISVLNFLITISTIKLWKNNEKNNKKEKTINVQKLHKEQEKVLDTLK